MGCYKKINGQLRIVSNHNECLASEESIIVGQSFGGRGKGKYKGEYCWGVAEVPLSGAFLKIGLYYIGDNYYSISGSRIRSPQDATLFALSGSAIEIDNSLVMTYTAVDTPTDNGGYITSIMGNIKVDKTTLSGTVAEVDVDAYPNGDDHIGDWYGSLIPIACP